MSELDDLCGVVIRCACGAEIRIPDRDFSETMVGFLSTPGHYHSPNCASFRQKCAACGRWNEGSLRRECPAPGCGWKGRAECFCHKGAKVERVVAARMERSAETKR